MKQILLHLLLVFFTIQLFAQQNVGIGTTSPSERLDVNGNVNIAGTIKTAGVAGTPGQVLTSTGTGLTWGSTQGYKHFRMVTTATTQNITLPADVTEVMVEVWGAGSAGTYNCGGTSGGYARTIQTISSGYTFSVTVGAGSSYSPLTTLNGGNSIVVFPNGSITAYGGGGVSSSTTPGYQLSGT